MSGNLTIDSELYRKGFGLKDEVAADLRNDYECDLVSYIQENGFELETETVHIVLAREFGFCYGVDRAVDYAYETRTRFPDRRLFLTTEIIHNPRVNQRLMEMGIRFLSGQYACGISIDELKPDDVVLLPAFGVSTSELERLRRTGCVVVDTTCGSVANVWRRVERYAREGYTSVIHGKRDHEETIATASRAATGTGKYLIVRNLAETEKVCETILGKRSREAFLREFDGSCSPGFDPDLHLDRIGVANQTTMLSSESLAIANRLRGALVARYGENEISSRFLSFDTICSATQDRQDAVLEMASRNLDLMIVVGGFNSSNTGHLCEIGKRHCPSYHIDDVSRIEGARRIRHKDPDNGRIAVTENWLPEGYCRIGFTAGASTPNHVIGRVIARILEFKGISPDEVVRRS